MASARPNRRDGWLIEGREEGVFFCHPTMMSNDALGVHANRAVEILTELLLDLVHGEVPIRHGETRRRDEGREARDLRR